MGGGKVLLIAITANQLSYHQNRDRAGKSEHYRRQRCDSSGLFRIIILFPCDVPISVGPLLS